MGRYNPGLALSDAQEQFLEATVALGAYSPETARPLAEFPKITERAIEQLLAAGLIRERAPGAYYVWERSLRARAVMNASRESAYAAPLPFTWRRFVKTTMLFLLLVLIPICLIKLSSK